MLIVIACFDLFLKSEVVFVLVFVSTMGGAAQALMKRIPRIKFPNRRQKPSGSSSETQALSSKNDGSLSFFSSSNASTSLGGKASLQPRRTLVTNEEIEAVLLGGCF